MTSQLNVDTIVDKAGSGGTNIKVGNTATYVSDGGNVTQNTVQGLTKAWAEYVQKGTQTIGDSFNVGSLTDNGTANTSLNFTNSMSNTDYSTSGGMQIDSWNSWIINYQGHGTGTVQQVIGAGTGPTQSDHDNVYFMMMGDLA